MTTRAAFVMVFACSMLSGCVDRAPTGGDVEFVWGQRGLSDGRLQRPRAMAIDDQGQLYIVDKTARIQVFTPDGEFVRGWSTPKSTNGKPCGLAFDNDGNLLVADTHYFRMLVYTPQGKLLEDKTIGGTAGHGQGEFEFVTDAVQDSKGNYYVAEYGTFDRIQKFTSQGKYVYEWGGHGEEPGQFIRPQGLEIDDQDRIWVADSCNHRIQVFDVSGERAVLVDVWGRQGDQLGELKYPYGLALDGQGHVYVSEIGNNRVQKFKLNGQPVAALGTPGHEKGEFHQPWALVCDAKGRVHVLDTYNHRVQRIRL